MGFVLGAVNGILIVVTRVPDIVVTLAMLFVLQGAALLVLDAPGGAAAEWLKALIVGTICIPGVPEADNGLDPEGAACSCSSASASSGFRCSARGSAFRSTPSAAASSRPSAAACRWRAPRSSPMRWPGFFAAMGGLTLTMSTGIGAPIPGPYLLASVAAVVLGGVTLGGGRGGLVGPIVAVFILRLVRTDLTLLAVDPNVTTIIEGTIMVDRRDARRLHRHAEAFAMSESAIAARPVSLGRRIRRFMSDQPLVPLIILLVAAGGDPADPAARHRQRALDRQHGQVRHSAGHPRRLPDHDHADRRHRPLGRHGGDDGRLHHGDAGRSTTIRRWRSSSRWCRPC